jgi:hypothetical protein
MDTLSELKASIREEIENIWIDEPEDVGTMRHGFFPSGAGAYDQHFSVLVMVGSEARGLAIHTFSNLVTFADSGQFDLEQLKYMAKEMLRITSGVIGYFGLKRLGEILNSFLKHMDEVTSITELRDLFADLFTLSNRYQMWLHQTFPWYLSVFFPTKTLEIVQGDLDIAQRLRDEGLDR